MKLLMIFQTSPVPPDLGPSKRNVPLLLENIKRHEVSVIAFGTPTEEQKFRDLYGKQCKHIVFVNNNRPRAFNLFLRIWYFLTGRSSYWRFYSSKLERALHDLLAREQFDLIHCCTTILGLHRLPEAPPLVGDTHNVEYDNVYRAFQRSRNPLEKIYFYWDYLRLKQEELECSRKFHVIVTTIERDREIYRRDGVDRPMVVIPNGVDPAFFEKQNVTEEPKSMVFAGLMSYFPNKHGIMYFLDEIFPRILEKESEARVYVVGAFPSKELLRRANPRIVVTGWVDDVRPYFARGQVFVIPLLVGGGIRGKALEAMAMRRPIVTTTIGCEGINLKHEESALFADSPQEFADAVVRLFRDANLRNALTQKAYQNVLEGYRWESSGLAFERIYQSLLSSNGKSNACHGGASQHRVAVNAYETM
jgi:glycosyltransferase involved in cell wall biosynthesis